MVRDHSFSHGLGSKEGAAQVGVEDQVPIVPGDLYGRFADIASRVVNQYVDPAIMSEGLVRHTLDTIEVAHIQFQGQCFPTERFDLILKCQESVFLRGW